MKILLSILIVLFSFSSTKSNDVGCLQMDIIILVDYSYSVEGYEHFIANALDGFVNRFDLSENGIRIAISIFNGNVYEMAHLTSDKKVLNNAINLINGGSAVGHTNMANALITANGEIVNNSRKDVRKMIIIISDGMPQFIPYTIGIARQMKELHNNLQICGIYVPSVDSSEDIMIMLSDLYVSSSYSILVQTLEELDLCF